MHVTVSKQIQMIYTYMTAVHFCRRRVGLSQTPKTSLVSKASAQVARTCTRTRTRRRRLLHFLLTELKDCSLKSLFLATAIFYTQQTSLSGIHCWNFFWATCKLVAIPALIQVVALVAANDVSPMPLPALQVVVAVSVYLVECVAALSYAYLGINLTMPLRKIPR